MKNTKLVVKKDPENEIPIEIFEESVVNIAKGFKKLLSSKLSLQAIVVLVHDSCPTGTSKVDVRNSLIAARDLEKNYLKP